MTKQSISEQNHNSMYWANMNADRENVFDVAVIGAGVVGCAIARQFALDGARVVVVEKAADVLDGASKGNSAILHTGFDAPEGSLEVRCMKEGYHLYRDIRERLNLPLIECGALVLAWNDDQLSELPALIARAHANGVTDVEELTRTQILELEPNLSEAVMGGFRVPGESLIDPWSAAHAYLLQALENGAELRRNSEVTGGSFRNGRWLIETSGGAIEAGLAVNAAGLFGDVVDRRLTGESWYRIRPRKGQFVVYDKPAAALAGHILLPVPTKTTKGIVVCRTAFGNLLVGPTAEEQEDRDHALLDRETMLGLIAKGEEIIPALGGHEVTAIYAGLRPATEEKDYRIRTDLAENYICVGGIRSTGLSAALGIAAYVAELSGLETRPLAEPVWPQMPMLCEYENRDWQNAGNGGVDCLCEMVTRREIENAMTGPLAAGSIGGLKRRTRVTMGRCQGFHCSAELARMTRGRLGQPMLPETDRGKATR
jgi:glycerol-3-phosphate dehydrogenase